MDRIQKIIDINILEESSLPDLLNELTQEVKDLSKQELMHIASEKLRLLAEADTIKFYKYGENEPFVDVPNQEVVKKLTQVSLWTYQGVNENIFVYSPNPSFKRDALKRAP